MSKITTESYVTLATNDSYCLGALTLAQSLKNVNTNRSMSIIITKGVSNSLQGQLKEVFDHVEVVDVLNSNDAVNLSLLKRPELGITFTKLHCWRLTQFSKCVFLDADCLVLSNVDDLFEREELSAATDVGWPDCFNSGVFVYKPSLQTYTNLLSFAVETGSFDGGDQGLLNSFFKSWSTSDSSRRLPFLYNMTTNVSYSYAPAFMKFKDQVKIVHFIGINKPWYNTFNIDTQSVVSGAQEHENQFLNKWWIVFSQKVFNSLPDDVKARIGGQLVNNSGTIEGNVQKGAQGSGEWSGHGQSHCGHGGAPGVVIGSDQHQNLWETGQIEYTGRDSFSNIQAHLDSQLQKK